MNSIVKKRRHVFETNSSSSHSLTVSESELLSTNLNKEILRKGTLNISVGEYNWDWYRYYSLEGKLRYIVTDLTLHDDVYSHTQFITEFPIMAEVVEILKDRFGLEVNFELDGISGGIDHQSVGMSKQYVENMNAEQLVSFLLSDSFIETGNDNDSPPEIIESDLGPRPYYAHKYAKVPDYHTMICLFLGGEAPSGQAVLIDSNVKTLPGKSSSDTLAELVGPYERTFDRAHCVSALSEAQLDVISRYGVVTAVARYISDGTRHRVKGEHYNSVTSVLNDMNDTEWRFMPEFAVSVQIPRVGDADWYRFRGTALLVAVPGEFAQGEGWV